MGALLQFHNVRRTEMMGDAAIDRDMPVDERPDEWTARELADASLWYSKRLFAEASLSDGDQP
ncbi:hypothetical protein [Paraburkholderia caribensis]|uniref:hypothetical protein n=1 Tax=Paraburkholderia caribensis TaxID=75105 RepID=UPI001CAF947B|nr:hypothetical protein [Paraburkholderia caribensis]CAG9255884.1 conserved hypothetical protein [Paraburkholderia caribensis]